MQQNDLKSLTGSRQSQTPIVPIKAISAEESSTNAQLLVRGGFVRKLIAGVYSYLPLGLRVLNNIERIIREEMTFLGSQELLLPSLMPSDPWKQTGRWETMADVFFAFAGAGGRELTLGPTHEEIVTPLVSQFVASYKDLPCSFFQIQTKYRNEARAKSGLLRGREFRMKDMYSFHTNQADLDAYYELALAHYDRIFQRCGIGSVTYKTYASGGAFCQYSHEYQMITPHGEDEIYLCDDCRIGINKEIIVDLEHRCPECSNDQLRLEKAIEVGNIFKLGDKYCRAFGMKYQDEQGQLQDQVVSGCYGIGSSRLMGAIVELCHDDKGICWPKSVTPYQIHLLSLVKKPEQIAEVDALFHALCAAGIEVLYDDRPNLSAGVKFAEADLCGLPFRLTVGPKSLANGQAELMRRDGSMAATLLDLAEIKASPQKFLKN